MSSAHSQRRRQYPPPWGGREIYQARVLALIALRNQPTELDDLRRSPGLAHATAEDLTMACIQLERAGRIRRSVSPVRYRHGDRILRRDVIVWTLEGRDAP